MIGLFFRDLARLSNRAELVFRGEVVNVRRDFVNLGVNGHDDDWPLP
ncbi:MAG: hypothetical protein FWF79_08585 [Defluviitaleaceae bacterium]|nr:hypothetical protein [Defluviitaleaceae bacterium]